jgi:hypothetical protein
MLNFTIFIVKFYKIKLLITFGVITMQYTQEVIDFLEMSYGKNMLSPGGNILDSMFSNCNLKNKKILEVGSGLGAAIRDIKGEYGIMGVLKNTFRREKVISAKEIIVC